MPADLKLSMTIRISQDMYVKLQQLAVMHSSVNACATYYLERGLLAAGDKISKPLPTTPPARESPAIPLGVPLAPTFQPLPGVAEDVEHD